MRPSPPARRLRHPEPSAWWALGLLAAFLITQHGYALTVAFINDDYVFLDKTRAASFFSLWVPRALAFHWYRPWSRELHYWTLQRLFGPRELPFHLVSFALALGILAGFFLLARRLAGGRAAAVATGGLAAMAAWGVPLVWVAGVQELWLLLFAIAFLHAVTAGSYRLALLPLGLALLSKESAAVLPAVALAQAVLMEGRAPRAALRRTFPLWLLTGVWALLHPVLGGRLWRPIADPLEPGLHPPLAAVAIRTLLVPFNLDVWPAPESGPTHALAGGLVGAALLGALVLWGARGAAPSTPPGPRHAVLLGVAWAAAGWTPLLMPTLGWHPYYGLLGACGAWLAIGALLARRTVGAVALIALLALLRAMRADTPSRDWGSEWYQRRAASFIGFMRADLKRQLPEPPPHTRFYFVRVPSNVGFLAGDGPALRVWYGDPTLRGGYYPSYRPRSSEEPPGQDLFFRYDSVAGWVPVVRGAENLDLARRLNPRWAVDHEVLAQALSRAGDWGAAAGEYQKLATAAPLRVEFAYNAGVCSEAVGDSVQAAQWYDRAARLPAADAEVRATARRFARYLPGSRRHK